MGTVLPGWRPFLSHPLGCKDLHLLLCSAHLRVRVISAFPIFPCAICTAFSSLTIIMAHTVVNGGQADPGQAVRLSERREGQSSMQGLPAAWHTGKQKCSAVDAVSFHIPWQQWRWRGRHGEVPWSALWSLERCPGGNPIASEAQEWLGPAFGKNAGSEKCTNVDLPEPQQPRELIQLSY